jgi:hypothetical protein
VEGEGGNKEQREELKVLQEGSILIGQFLFLTPTESTQTHMAWGTTMAEIQM